MIHAIAAVDGKNGMSKRGVIPWNIPNDKTFYQNKINNHLVLMGYNTYTTHPKPFGNKPNYVLSDRYFEPKNGYIVVTSESLPYVLNQQEDIWVIGGAQTFEQLLSKIDKIYLTHVVGDFGCDTFFPSLDNFVPSIKEVKQHQNSFDYTVQVWTRREIKKMQKST